jgi:hypothetical protein
MQGLRILIVLVVLQALVGCKPPVVWHVTYVNTTEGRRLETHTVIKKGTDLTWKFNDGPFSVQFNPGENPCVPSGGADPNTYLSTATAPFTVSCTVNTTMNTHSFGYQINYPNPAPIRQVTPCRGCYADTE